MREIALGAAMAAMLMLAGQHASAAQDYRLLQLEGRYVKWGSPRLGTPAVVTYALAQRSTAFPQARNCKTLRPINRLITQSGISDSAFRGELWMAFRVWEAAANIQFHETKNPETADIIIGAQGTSRGRAFTNVDYERAAQGRTRSITKALICLNPEMGWKIGFDGNADIYDVRYTLVHEIGHAIGLGHPGPDGVVMSFKYQEAFRTLQAGDVIGATSLYGASASAANAATSAGATNGSAEGDSISVSSPQLSLGNEQDAEDLHPVGLK